MPKPVIERIMMMFDYVDRRGLLFLREAPRHSDKVGLGTGRQFGCLFNIETRREHAVAAFDVGVVGDVLRQAAGTLVDLDVVKKLIAGSSQADDERFVGVEGAGNMQRITTDSAIQHIEQQVLAVIHIIGTVFVVYLIQTLHAIRMNHRLFGHLTLRSSKVTIR